MIQSTSLQFYDYKCFYEFVLNPQYGLVVYAISTFVFLENKVFLYLQQQQ